MIRKKEIEIPIYGGFLLIMITDEPVNVNNHYSHPEEDIEVEYAHCIEVDSVQDGKPSRSLLTAFKVNNEYANITNGVIAHEALHVVELTAEHIGLHWGVISIEAYTYLLGWVVDQIHAFFKDVGQRIYLDK